MFLRFVYFFICQLSGGLLGWFGVQQIDAQSTLAARLAGALVGVLMGGLAWLLVDAVRAARLLQWLRAGDAASSVLTVGLWGEVADRTRRQMRARDQKIQASDARLQDFLAALQASPNGVVLLDDHARIEWFNQTAASHFGLEAHRDLLQHFGNLVRDPGFAAYSAGHDYQRDVVMHGRESTPARPVKLAVHLHPYGDGRLLLLSRDITALEQAEAMRRDFVANVSHEIRTPLTVLAGFVEILQTLPVNAQERKRYLDLMSQQSQRMQTLVNDLLTLSRLEGGPAVGAMDWVSMHLLLSEVTGEARALASLLAQAAPVSAHSRELRLEVSEDSGIAEIAGAQSELLSAMTNLVSNAIRYSPLGSPIHVGWHRLADGSGEFSVQDTGPGFAPEHIPRLTERFYRIDSSRSRDTGGTGLGLAIVKHVAQRHGAELRIASTPGVGSRFSIVFPPGRVRAGPRALAATGVIHLADAVS
jgi:two-component system, OmpR family, phosphate regulon sensor histidine kinase PhoR